MARGSNGRLARSLLLILLGGSLMFGGAHRWLHGNGFDQEARPQRSQMSAEVAIWPSILAFLAGFPCLMGGLWKLPHDSDR
jgi:hypothetical protein